MFGVCVFFGVVSFMVCACCSYTDPEIAHVGLHDDDAAVDVFRLDFAENDRSICEGDTGGFVKVLVEKVCVCVCVCVDVIVHMQALSCG